eukprot:Rhum_TRINITY_DN14766_c22_g1::Rhum_TRINITY_DN14766_c22_g1_i1::g.115142::m.115142
MKRLHSSLSQGGVYLPAAAAAAPTRDDREAENSRLNARADGMMEKSILRGEAFQQGRAGGMSFEDARRHADFVVDGAPPAKRRRGWAAEAAAAAAVAVQEAEEEEVTTATTSSGDSSDEAQGECPTCLGRHAVGALPAHAEGCRAAREELLSMGFEEAKVEEMMRHAAGESSETGVAALLELLLG